MFGELTGTFSSEQDSRVSPLRLFPILMLPIVLAMVDSNIHLTVG